MPPDSAPSLLPLYWYATLPFWPLLGAILVGIMIATRRSRGVACWPVVLGGLASLVLAACLLVDRAQLHGGGQPEPSSAPAVAEAGVERAESTHEAESVGPWVFTLYNWISLGNEQSLINNQWIDVNFFMDELSGVMLIVVTLVGLMVIIYSIGYMRDHHGHAERGYERFFAFLGLFVFSMCVLVLAGNFVLLYLGWEAVGLCSYLLIGFYYKKPEAAAAAKKAFIVNRIGDFGFALGIFALYMFIRGHVQPGENPLDYTVVFHYVGEGALSVHQTTTVALLLMCGALGKSAQFPLYIWLPDAMEGPSPVSALIHAATMVTAGIYMIARCWPIFSVSPIALNVVLVLGVIGAFLAASMAMAQYDLKRILAYSTISQLAFMFVGLGCGVPQSAIFHLYTHAFFKALLFLCAGSVMHAMGGIVDVRQFSGLKRLLPKTYWLMLIGCLSLSGFPLLAGFWSKDEIVHAAFEHNTVVGIIMLATAAMTAYYTFRMFFLCFHGSTRVPDEAGEHVHDSPPVMINPLIVLAFGAIFAGYAGVTLYPSAGESFLGFLKPHGQFHHYLEFSTLGGPPGPGAADATAAVEHGDLSIMYISAVVAIAGIVLAWARYGQAPAADPDQAALGGLWNLWNAKYYVDEINDRILVRPLRRLGDLFFAIDNHGVDGVIWFVTAVPRGMGSALRYLQQGALQAYALGMAIGVAVLLILWKWMDAAVAGGVG